MKLDIFAAQNKYSIADLVLYEHTAMCYILNYNNFIDRYHINVSLTNFLFYFGISLSGKDPAKIFGMNFAANLVGADKPRICPKLLH